MADYGRPDGRVPSRGAWATMLITSAAAVSVAALGGCSTTAVPLDSPAAATASPAPVPSLYAEGGAARPSGDNDFVDGANDSDAAESPTFTDADLADQVDRAARGFLSASLDRGYPDENDEAYRRKLQQLTTSAGFAAQQRVDAKRDPSTALDQLYARHLRTRAQEVSVRPAIASDHRATATVDYRLVTQHLEGTTWRTVTTGSQQRRVLVLVDPIGTGWLVASVTQAE